MKKLSVLAIVLTAPLLANAITIPHRDMEASEKIKFMQDTSRFDRSLLAAYVQADQTFTQWCGSSATVKDLRRIAAQDGFTKLYTRLSSGQSQGMTQTKALLINDNPKFCKE